MKSPFSKEIYIRLSDDEAAFTCTSYRWFLSKMVTFSLRNQPHPADTEVATPPATRWPRSLLGLTDES